MSRQKPLLGQGYNTNGHTDTPTHTQACTHTITLTQKHAQTHAYMDMDTHAHMCTHTHNTHMCTHTCVHTHMCTHTHVHTPTQIFFPKGKPHQVVLVNVIERKENEVTSTCLTTIQKVQVNQKTICAMIHLNRLSVLIN